jgi:hypothetical protein
MDSNMTALTEFKLFSNLPIEIRLKIWILVMETLPGYAIHIDHTNKTGFTLEAARPYPLIGFTCHDAAFALSKVMIPLFKQQSIQPHSPDLGVRIIPAIDTIIFKEFPEKKMEWLIEALNDGIGAKIRHLGLICSAGAAMLSWRPNAVFFNMTRYMERLAPTFPNLIDCDIIMLTPQYRKRRTGKAAIFKLELIRTRLLREALMSNDPLDFEHYMEDSNSLSGWWRAIRENKAVGVLSVVADSYGGDDTSGSVVIRGS